MIKLRNMLKSQGGFTLIELMVVIVVIGIIAALAVPRVLGVLGDAQVETCKANFQNIETAIERYYAKYKDYPANLNALSPEFLKEVPVDPADPAKKKYGETGADSTYTRTGATTYTFTHTATGSTWTH